MFAHVLRRTLAGHVTQIRKEVFMVNAMLLSMIEIISRVGEASVAGALPV